MKIKIIITTLLFTNTYIALSQQLFQSNEVGINVNIPSSTIKKSSSQLGFGIQYTHAYQADKALNFLLGFGYNRLNVSQTIAITEDIENHSDFSINSASITTGVRYNFGQMHNFFMQAGTFTDANFFPIETIRYMTCPKLTFFTPGCFIGAGIRVHISTIDFSLKADYKSLFDREFLFNNYYNLGIGIYF